jgi:hypothetical protein
MGMMLMLMVVVVGGRRAAAALAVTASSAFRASGARITFMSSLDTIQSILHV